MAQFLAMITTLEGYASGQPLPPSRPVDPGYGQGTPLPGGGGLPPGFWVDHGPGVGWRPVDPGFGQGGWRPTDPGFGQGLPPHVGWHPGSGPWTPGVPDRPEQGLPPHVGWHPGSGPWTPGVPDRPSQGLPPHAEAPIYDPPGGVAGGVEGGVVWIVAWVPGKGFRWVMVKPEPPDTKPPDESGKPEEPEPK